MSKDVAVVHWQDGGIEKKARAYTIQMLSQLIETMEKRGFMYWVCLTRLDTIIPIRSQKPYKAFNTPTEYVDKEEPHIQQHRSFRDVTRIDRIHHPPTNAENQAHAEKVRKIYREVQSY